MRTWRPTAAETAVLLACIILAGVLALCVVFGPARLARPEPGLTAAERLSAENDARSTLLQGLVGLLALAHALLTAFVRQNAPWPPSKPDSEVLAERARLQGGLPPGWPPRRLASTARGKGQHSPSGPTPGRTAPHLAERADTWPNGPTPGRTGKSTASSPDQNWHSVEPGNIRRSWSRICAAVNSRYSRPFTTTRAPAGHTAQPMPRVRSVCDITAP